MESVLLLALMVKVTCINRYGKEILDNQKIIVDIESAISKIYAVLLVANQKCVFFEIKDKYGGVNFHSLSWYVDQQSL